MVTKERETKKKGMPYKIEIRQMAVVEILEAYDWYELQQPGLGSDFLHEVEMFYKNLKINPKVHSYYSKPVRQGKIGRFPYLVVYEIFVHHGGVQRTDDASWCVVFNKSVFGSWCFHLIHLTTSLLGSSCGLKFLVIMFFPLHLILFLEPFMAFIKTFKTESGVELLGSLKF